MIHSQPRPGPSHPLPVAVVGCGRMGKLHSRVFSEMPSVKLVAVHDVDLESAEQTAEQYGVRAATIDELLDEVRAVVIAVPTQHHLPTAEPFLKRGIACLIEKPLAQDVQTAESIAALAREHGAVVQVGHIERFNPAIRSMERMGIQPRFMEVIRISPLTFRSIDVGVVLDMMIHDIDIVLKLADSRVKKLEAVGVSVLGTAEDICNARITFENGCVANLTASRLALKTERRLRVFSRDAYVSLDYQKRYGVVAHRQGNLEAIRDAVARIRTGEVEDLSELDYSKLVNVQELEIDDVEPLRAELDAFVDAAAGGSEPVVSVQAGVEAVRIAHQIVAAIEPQEL